MEENGFEKFLLILGWFVVAMSVLLAGPILAGLLAVIFSLLGIFSSISFWYLFIVGVIIATVGAFALNKEEQDKI